jgi:hypothetical protein
VSWHDWSTDEAIVADLRAAYDEFLRAFPPPPLKSIRSIAQRAYRLHRINRRHAAERTNSSRRRAGSRATKQQRRKNR